MKLPYAEDLNYWKTGKSPAGSWLDKASAQIEKLGGTVLMQAKGTHPATGRTAFMLAFEIGGDSFKAVWPVLPIKKSRSDKTQRENEAAAEVQAATMLYHDVKAKCMAAAVLGARTAFFSYLMLPGGMTAAEVSTPELADVVTRLFPPALPSGK